MASESRIVRPFGSVDDIQSALEELRLRFGRDTHIEPGERLLASPADFGLATIQLNIGRPGFRDGIIEACRSSRTPVEHLRLQVRARSPYLRIHETLWDAPIEEIGEAPSHIELATGSDRPRSLQSIHHGSEIEVQVVLVEELHDQPPLNPWRKGSWLGRVRFVLDTVGSHATFVPKPLTLETRQAFQLPEGTFQYAKVDAHASLQSDADFNDAVTLYVDEIVLGRLSAAPESAASDFIQRQLFVDSISALMLELHSTCSQELEDRAWDELRFTTLGRLLESLPFPGGGEGALQCLLEDPDRLITFIEARAGLGAAAAALLEVGS